MEDFLLSIYIFIFVQLIEGDMTTAAKTGELSPRLIQLREALEGIPSSSVSSERAFSSAGNICTKLRNRLNPEKLDLFAIGRSFYMRSLKISILSLIFYWVHLLKMWEYKQMIKLLAFGPEKFSCLIHHYFDLYSFNCDI